MPTTMEGRSGGAVFNRYCLNVSTTPITAMRCRQCLPLSVVQLKGKHCRKPHCRNGVVDTFGHYWVYSTSRVFIFLSMIFKLLRLEIHDMESTYVPYAHHYKPRLVYFLPHYSLLFIL